MFMGRRYSVYVSVFLCVGLCAIQNLIENAFWIPIQLLNLIEVANRIPNWNLNLKGGVSSLKGLKGSSFNVKSNSWYCHFYLEKQSLTWIALSMFKSFKEEKLPSLEVSGSNITVVYRAVLLLFFLI